MKSLPLRNNCRLGVRDLRKMAVPYRPNEPSLSSERRLFVDVSNIARRDIHTGIQRVVRALLSGMGEALVGRMQVCPIYASARRGYRHLPRLGRVGSLLGAMTSERITARSGDVFLGLDLNAHFLPRYEEQIRAWRGVGVSSYMVVYDLLPHHHPEWFNDTTVVAFARWLGVVRREADGIICISRAVEADVRTWLQNEDGGVSNRRVATMRLGSDLGASVPSRGKSRAVSRIAPRLLATGFVLMVGTIEPRKDYELAIDVFERLWRRPVFACPALVIVGRPGWKTERLQKRLMAHPEIGSRLFWLSDASDETLAWLYSNAQGLLMTSRGEGFGLPIVEAEGYGLPILARDIPVFREAAGGEATFFAAEDPVALEPDIMAWLRKIARAKRSSAVSATNWRETVGDLCGIIDPNHD